MNQTKFTSKRDELAQLSRQLLGDKAGQATPKQLRQVLLKEGHKRVDVDTSRAVYMRLRRAEAKAKIAGEQKSVTLGKGLSRAVSGARRYSKNYGRIE